MLQPNKRYYTKKRGGGDYHPAKLSIYIAVKALWGLRDYVCALFQNMIE